MVLIRTPFLLYIFLLKNWKYKINSSTLWYALLSNNYDRKKTWKHVNCYICKLWSMNYHPCHKIPLNHEFFFGCSSWCRPPQVGMHYQLIFCHISGVLKNDLHTIWVEFLVGCFRQWQRGHSEWQPGDNASMGYCLLLNVGLGEEVALSMSNE